MAKNEKFTARRMTRRDVLGAGAATAAAAFAAPVFIRGASAQTPEPTVKLNTSVSGDLVEWGYGIQETNPLARSRVLAFEKTYPNVKLTIVDSFDDQKLLTAAASKTLPDLLWLSRSVTSQWAARGILRPLTDYIKKDGYDMSRFYKFAVDEASYKGDVYGVPGSMDVRGLYMDLDALQKVGVDGKSLDTSDWDQLNQLGPKLLMKEGAAIKRWGFDNKLLSSYLWLWGMGNGGHFLNDDASEATFNDDKNVEALDWGVTGFKGQGGGDAYQKISSTWQGDEQFARGQVAMTLYEQWMMSGMIAPVNPKMNFWVLPIREKGAGTDGKMVSFSGGNGWYISKDAKNPDAAWEFIKFMHSDATWMLGAKAVLDYRKSQGKPYVPSLTGDIAVDKRQVTELYQSINPNFDHAVQLWPELLQQSSSLEISKSPVGGQLADIMLNVGTKPAVNGSKSAKDALDDANSQAQDAIDSF